MHKKNRKNSEDLTTVLNKNIDLLLHFEKKQEIKQLKNSIQIYSLLQTASKIIKPDFLSFYKYDYSKKFLPINFIISISHNENSIQKSILEDVTVSSSLLTLNIFKNDNNIYLKYVDDITGEGLDNKIYNACIEKKITKIYCKNILSCDKNPIGFIIFAYKDKDFIMNEDDKTDVIRITDKIKEYI